MSPDLGHGGRRRPRVLALVACLKWLHVDYLHALAERFDLNVAYCGVGHLGAVAAARREGLRLRPLPAGSLGGRRALAEVIAAVDPEIIHVLYYRHEELAVLARELSEEALVLFECRDPLTTLERAPGSAADKRARERRALQASDGQVFVSHALRRYLERQHGIALGATSEVVAHGFRLAALAPPSAKLSAGDGRTHLALVGTASGVAGHSRYYVDIIERLTGLGFVVHSHFFAPPNGDGNVYLDLARRNPDYRHHAVVALRRGTELSRAMSRYDLMGVFHHLDAAEHDESDTLSVCMPTKAVCGWFHGGIPVVCSSHYGGLVERIDRHGIGFVYDRWDELAALAAGRDAVAAATARTLAMRARFSNEWGAAQVERLARRLLTGRAAVATCLAARWRIRGEPAGRPAKSALATG